MNFKSKRLWLEIAIGAGWVFSLLGYFIFQEFAPFGMPDGDVYLYHSLGVQAEIGRVPYLDFVFEYPPASIFVFALPAYITASIAGYLLTYQVLSWLVMLISAFGVYRLVRLLHKDEKNAFSIFTLTSVISWIIMMIAINRFDAFSYFLTVLGLYTYILGEKTQKKKFQSLSWVLFIVGGLVKLYPGFVLPFLFVKEIARKEWRLLLQNIVVSTVFSLPFLLWIGLGFEGFWFFLTYHGERGIEIESLYASLILAGQYFFQFQDEKVVYEFASLGFRGPISDWFASISLPLFVTIYTLALSGFAWYASIVKRKQEVLKMVVLAVIFVMVAFPAFNKVFSAQYVIWFGGLLPLIILYLKKWSSRFWFTILSLMVPIITILVFPFFWGAYTGGYNELLITLMILRNASLAMLALILTAHFWLEARRLLRIRKG